MLMPRGSILHLIFGTSSSVIMLAVELLRQSNHRPAISRSLQLDQIPHKILDSLIALDSRLFQFQQSPCLISLALALAWINECLGLFNIQRMVPFWQEKGVIAGWQYEFFINPITAQPSADALQLNQIPHEIGDSLTAGAGYYLSLPIPLLD
eukprot:scaffold126214_cov62-Cyclotella_meneghiniana.AAC.3